MEDVRLTYLDLRLEPGQPGGAVAEPTPRIVVLAAIPEGADPEIRARGQHLYRSIIRGRVELNRLERAAVSKVLRERTRIRTGVERQLSDYFLCDHQNDAAVNAPNS
jgi:UDP-N-acetyl-D-mannosaminuronate dehydrogenase